MSILTVGAGATGGYLGASLVRAGRDVRFLVRPGRAAQLARDGLVLRTTEATESVPVSTYTAADLPPEPADVVLVTVKAQALPAVVPASGFTIPAPPEPSPGIHASDQAGEKRRKELSFLAVEGSQELIFGPGNDAVEVFEGLSASLTDLDDVSATVGGINSAQQQLRTLELVEL